MRKLVPILGLIVLCGCAVTTRRDAEYYFRWGTEVAFGQHAPDDPSEARADLLPWVQDWINREQIHKHTSSSH